MFNRTLAFKNHLNPLQKFELTYPRTYLIVPIFKFAPGLINKDLRYIEKDE